MRVRGLTTFAFAAATLGAAPLPPAAAGPEEKVSAEDAHAIAVDAYVYFYPLVTMDLTRKQFTNIEPGKEFGKGATPPVNAFWSITLYDSEGFQVGNVLNRFAVSSYMPFVLNADGSLDLLFQNESPGKDLEANWLPAPKGAFNLCMRLYGPKSDALTGRWNPPAVTRTEGGAEEGPK